MAEGCKASDCTQGGGRELPERRQSGDQLEKMGKAQLMPYGQEAPLVSKQPLPGVP